MKKVIKASTRSSFSQEAAENIYDGVTNLMDSIEECDQDTYNQLELGGLYNELLEIKRSIYYTLHPEEL